MSIDVTIRYFPGCPHWELARQRLDRAIEEAGLGGRVRVRLEKVDTPEHAERVGFLGSPTILIDGTDPFAGGASGGGLTCRVYETEDGTEGAPSVAQLVSVLRSRPST